VRSKRPHLLHNYKFISKRPRTKKRKNTDNFPRTQITPPRTRVRGTAIETPPHAIAQLRRRVFRVHDLYHTRAAAAAAALGRSHRGAEDGAGEGIQHVPAVRDGEGLGHVLRVWGAVTVVAAVHVRVGVVLRGRGCVHVAALVAAREVVRGAVVLRCGRAARCGACVGGGDGGAVEGGGG
jgi:hypothetical protein